MGYIYKVTNKLNKKVYIGQTILSPLIRWKRHLFDAANGDLVKFHRALRKYEKEVFIWEVIEEIDNEFLNDREIYWIGYYDSYKNGYNSTEGGQNPPRHDMPIICIETKLIYESAADAERQTSIRADHILACAHRILNRVTTGGYHWMFVNEYDEFGPIVRKTKNELTSKSVKCIETNIVYPSILAASKSTGISRSTIKNSLENKVKIDSKFHWIYNK